MNNFVKTTYYTFQDVQVWHYTRLVWMQYFEEYVYVFLGIPPNVELIPANGNDMYTVNPGREFSVTCQSTGQFSGEVQWLQANGNPVPDIGTK